MRLDFGIEVPYVIPLLVGVFMLDQKPVCILFFCSDGIESRPVFLLGGLVLFCGEEIDDAAPSIDEQVEILGGVNGDDEIVQGRIQARRT